MESDQYDPSPAYSGLRPGARKHYCRYSSLEGKTKKPGKLVPVSRSNSIEDSLQTWSDTRTNLGPRVTGNLIHGRFTRYIGKE